MGLDSHASLFAPPPPRADGRVNLAGLSRDELAAAVTEMGEPAFRAQQLWRWIYNAGETDFDRMSNIAKPLRTRLAERFVVARPAESRGQHSFDGTAKWLLRMDDGQEVETVHIPEEDRGTLCVSSQVGCTLTCRFCHTGTQRLVRNLEASEIVGQVMLARDRLEDWRAPEGERKLTNIVLMGMGEPLYNFDNVAKAMRIVMDGEGISISRRRITLSTSGVVPMMQRCGEELGVNLAVSLHAVTDELRDELVPLNRKYPVKELLDACRAYPGTSNARRITFEYVMLKGVNDTLADARELVRLLDGIPAKVNLIPFNPWPGAPYECSTKEAIQRFSEVLMEAGYASPVRTPRGRDIQAACGQLKSDSVRQRRARPAVDSAVSAPI
ncbi:23S rRNA (adenine(2503)-C(2))-methyltransferase RlmN [Inquilinus sp. CAU 1745]|uniref:23S rRNA (adenine(2503)-C(2))-methyltransferase RlmN n=1 Tax=Inquilinus sp. CAU 1745 TaxID=3140369 RepID=UPI00325C0860